MSEDQLTLLTLDLHPDPDPIRSGAIFEHVQRSPPTFPTMPLISAPFTIIAVQLTFIPDWSRFSDRLQSGMDRSPVEWGYMIVKGAKLLQRDCSLYMDKYMCVCIVCVSVIYFRKTKWTPILQFSILPYPLLQNVCS